MVFATSIEFGPAAVRGLAELGAVDASRGDLSLELGVSVWLRWSGISLEEARATLLEIRDLVLDVSALDEATEPIPLIGRSAKLDVVHLAAYVGDLIGRAAATTGCGRSEVARRVIEVLPEREAAALGA
jgi:hypothetical protein